MATRVPSIKVIQCELVRPSKPTPKEVKLLSDIDDQELLRFHVPAIFFYNNNNNNNHSIKAERDPIRVIREALGKALVYYYPLAGRLREGFNKKLAVDCTAEGLLFVSAEADVDLDQLGDAIWPPYPFVDEILARVPGYDGTLGCPLLLTQVTRLKCGGFVLALRIHHTICDGFGILQFLNAIAEMARGEHAPSVPPVWKRYILGARTPPRITYPHHEYQHPTPPSKDLSMTIDPNNNVQKSFFFGHRQVKALRNQVPPGKPCTRSDLITACLWKCRTVALNLSTDDTVKLSCIINTRGKKKFNLLSLPVGYYGNAFAYPAAVARAGALGEAPLGYAVELEVTESGGEYMRSVADLMASRGRPSFVTEGIHIVSDVTQIAFHGVDFGWGPAVYAGPVEATPVISFIFSVQRRGEEGVFLLICLPSDEAMKRFEREVKKLTGKHEITETINLPNQVCQSKGFKINSSM